MVEIYLRNGEAHGHTKNQNLTRCSGLKLNSASKSTLNQALILPHKYHQSNFSSDFTYVQETRKYRSLFN